MAGSQSVEEKAFSSANGYLALVAVFACLAGIAFVLLSAESEAQPIINAGTLHP